MRRWGEVSSEAADGFAALLPRPVCGPGRRVRAGARLWVIAMLVERAVELAVAAAVESVASVFARCLLRVVRRRRGGRAGRRCGSCRWGRSRRELRGRDGAAAGQRPQRQAQRLLFSVSSRARAAGSCGPATGNGRRAPARCVCTSAAAADPSGRRRSSQTARSSAAGRDVEDRVELGNASAAVAGRGVRSATRRRGDPQQLQLPQDRLLTGRGPIEIAAPATRRCATASASIGSDSPRALPPPAAAPVSFGGTRTSRFARGDQVPLEPAGQHAGSPRSPTAARREAAPPRKQRIDRPLDVVSSSSIRPDSSTATAVSELVHVHSRSRSSTHHLHNHARAATGRAGQASLERSSHSSYQVTLDESRTGGGDTTLASLAQPDVRMESAAANPSLRPRPGRHHATENEQVSSGMSPVTLSSRP